MGLASSCALRSEDPLVGRASLSACVASTGWAGGIKDRCRPGVGFEVDLWSAPSITSDLRISVLGRAAARRLFKRSSRFTRETLNASAIESAKALDPLAPPAAEDRPCVRKGRPIPSGVAMTFLLSGGFQL